mmetsp:Transcript_27363/g.43833  ORF Transcript_27363/g.43833 Transcript_27363/m.43833 type:complete len:547 (-) Transcript_27363:215-1855(-)
MDAGRPAKCSLCAASIEDASLLLVCRHHLCLQCAAQSLSRGQQLGKIGNAPMVQCRRCQAVTPVEDDAAAYLEHFFSQRQPDVAASFVSSGPGSSTTQELSSPIIVGSSLPRALLPENGAVPVIFDKESTYDKLMSEIPKAQTKSLSQPLFPAPQKSPPGSGHGSRAPSPVRAIELKTPRPVRTCGQCEERPADLHCEQCDELFCRSCAAAIHRRGAMSKHHLRLHVGTEETAPSSPPYKVATTATVEKTGDPVCIVRKFLRCPVHSEEPLQFFCLTCECECICAECALHGDHRGHEVLNLREAAKHLPEKAGELISNARMRSDELVTVTDRVSKCNNDIDNLVCASREELRRQFEQVQTGLLAEEKALMKEVERCFTEVATILQTGEDGYDGKVRAAEASLRVSHHGEKDAIEALNAFSKLKAVLHAQPAPKRKNISAKELQFQLEQSFKSRLASINSLSVQIDSLWVAVEEVPSAESKTRFAFGGLGSEIDADDWGYAPPTTPRFATAGLCGFSPQQEPSLVLPAPQRSQGQASKWANPARFGN